jgi:hypothetical protein
MGLYENLLIYNLDYRECLGEYGDIVNEKFTENDGTSYPINQSINQSINQRPLQFALILVQHNLYSM